MINLLDIHVANLIAAGEVVDRPSSALKELVENAIDAGATHITAEIQNGGIKYMKVSDNGEGMTAEDLGRSILRHATSKIKSETDLARIQTLGFRGEALAAISSVTDLKIFTKTRESQTGYLLEASSGQNVSISEAGCPDGTTVIIERMFSKIPARQKFLKRDATEGMYCKWIIEKIAVSNPSISFKFIQDGKQKIFTPGNGGLKDAIYAVFGGETADNMICVKELETSGIDEERVKISGFVSRIEDGRKTRAEENFFVNGRYVYSKTIMSALEEAYKSVADTSRFPFCVLNIKIDESNIDINVHPQKTEVKFSDEKKIYSAVYYAVRNALESSEHEAESQIDAGPVRPSKQTPHIIENNSDYTDERSRAQSISILDDYKQSEKIYDLNLFNKTDEYAGRPAEPQNRTGENRILPSANRNNYKIIGEAFYGYIFLEKDEKIVIIDKHAAHERIIYDIILKRAAENKKSSQILLAPIEVKLTAQETAGILNIEQDLRKLGIEFEWRGDNISISEVPTEIADADIAEIIKDVAYKSSDSGFGAGDMHKIAELAAGKYAACRAAMKSGLRDNPEDIIWLADRVTNYEDVKYCPHGRPVAFEISKTEIEKRFKR